MGDARRNALLQESLHLATRSGAAKPADFTRVIVDTRLQPKAVTFPTDAKLLHRHGKGWCAWHGSKGVKRHQSHVRFGKTALRARSNTTISPRK
jgi:IS5 family transposase